MYNIKISAKIENLDKLFSFFEENMIKEGCSKRDVMSMKVVAEEVFVNIASYAYAPNEGDVIIIMEIHKNPLEIMIEFKDSGMQYNPLEKQDPDISLDIMDRPIGGLGIFMIKEIMDDVQYEYADGMNILSMRKLL